MWKLHLLFLSVCVFTFIDAQTDWMGRATVANHEKYTSSVLQEMISTVESRGFSSLKLNEYNQTINSQLYNFSVVGTVTYRNGFVISIQKIDLNDFQETVNNRVVNGVSAPTATTRAKLNLRDAMLGFDVLTDIEGMGQNVYTGTYTHSLIQYQVDLSKNLLTGEFSVSVGMNSLSAGSGIRMIYMPTSNITEAISRSYMPSNNWSAGTAVWAREVFSPILLDIMTNKIEFPGVCFNYNCN